MNHSDYVTDITHAEDVPYLRTPLFNVNMRLYRTSPQYRNVVQAAVYHITCCCLTKAKGYKLPHGFSGANAGIPWNIIGIARNRGQLHAYAQIMINPRIIARSTEMIESQSNCGSIRLPEPITVRRHAWVTVEWYDGTAAFCRETFNRDQGGLTIQHEVDHNLGILITDRAVEPVIA